MLEEKLKILTASGVVICPRDEMEDAVLDETPARATAVEPDAGNSAVRSSKMCNDPKKDNRRAEKEKSLSKKVITGLDLEQLQNDKVTRVYVGEKAIVTDVAMETAKAGGIEIVRG